MATQQGFTQTQRNMQQSGSALGGFAAHYPVGTSAGAVPPVSVNNTNNSSSLSANGSQSASTTTGTTQQERPTPVIDLKVILSKDEVAYVFGFDGVLIAQLRQQTGANVGITQGESHEHVLCIGGTIEIIFKAFSLVCRKLWDFLTGVAGGPGHDLPLTLRLAVPASQCGSIIGKQGAKVKEIRDLTGAVIQVIILNKCLWTILISFISHNKTNPLMVVIFFLYGISTGFTRISARFNRKGS